MKSIKAPSPPTPTSTLSPPRRYWAVHRHPLLLFPNVGRGDRPGPVARSLLWPLGRQAFVRFFAAAAAALTEKLATDPGLLARSAASPPSSTPGANACSCIPQRVNNSVLTSPASSSPFAVEQNFALRVHHLAVLPGTTCLDGATDVDPSAVPELGVVGGMD